MEFDARFGVHRRDGEQRLHGVRGFAEPRLGLLVEHGVFVLGGEGQVEEELQRLVDDLDLARSQDGVLDPVGAAGGLGILTAVFGM